MATATTARNETIEALGLEDVTPLVQRFETHRSPRASIEKSGALPNRHALRMKTEDIQPVASDRRTNVVCLNVKKGIRLQRTFGHPIESRSRPLHRRRERLPRPSEKSFRHLRRPLIQLCSNRGPLVVQCQRARIHFHKECNVCPRAIASIFDRMKTFAAQSSLSIPCIILKAHQYATFRPPAFPPS